MKSTVVDESLSSFKPMYCSREYQASTRMIFLLHFQNAIEIYHSWVHTSGAFYEMKMTKEFICRYRCSPDVIVKKFIKAHFRLKPSLNFIHWNQEGWKTGLCSVPPVGHPYSLLTLANNTCVRHSFTDLRDRFSKLFKRKVTMGIKITHSVFLVRCTHN